MNLDGFYYITQNPVFIIFRHMIAEILIHDTNIYFVDLDLFQIMTDMKIISPFMIIYLYTLLPFFLQLGYICNQGEQVT